MARDSVLHTLLVATLVCIVCSVLVAGAAVGLRPRQQSNKILDQKKNVLLASGILSEGQRISDDEIEQLFTTSIEKILINLETGNPAVSEAVDPETYDQRAASKDPARSVPIPPAQDLAGIKQREKYGFVYKVRDPNGQLDQIVLPINGKGLWSTLYGFLALDADGTTVRGITFYEHRETPGLGAEIANPKWRAIWPGKQIFDESGEIKLEVIKGVVLPDSPSVNFEVDGISGATITSKGVTNLIRYWLGPDAFGPYLERLRQQEEGANRG